MSFVVFPFACIRDLFTRSPLIPSGSVDLAAFSALRCRIFGNHEVNS